MSISQNKTNDNALQLTKDYIPDDEVGCYPDYPNDINAIPRDADRFGNVIESILFFNDVYGTMEIALASRRNDCYNHDGSRPDWYVYTAGKITGVTTTNDWDGFTPGEVLEWVLESLDIKGYGLDGDNIVIEVYDRNEAESFEITFILDGDSDE